MTLADTFIQAFDVWEEARAYVSFMVGREEMQLVVAARDRSITVEEAAGLLDRSPTQAAYLLHRAYERHVMDKVVEDGIAKYRPSTFPQRLNHFAKFENWDDIPAEDRQRINRRFLDEFVAHHVNNITLMMRGQEPEGDVPNDAVLLLHEVEAILALATHIIVQPCDCRRLGQNCDRPVETCIWLDDAALEALERGYGRRLSVEEAVSLVRRADRAGLMHTGDASALLGTEGGQRTPELHAICNCCACDCYPFLAAQELGSKGVWPHNRYAARYNSERCNLCGACVKRCHFGAFYHDGTGVASEGEIKPKVFYDPDRCWGCGLCANTCPSEAIVMEPLA